MNSKIAGIDPPRIKKKKKTVDHTNRATPEAIGHHLWRWPGSGRKVMLPSTLLMLCVVVGVQDSVPA